MGHVEFKVDIMCAFIFSILVFISTRPTICPELEKLLSLFQAQMPEIVYRDSGRIYVDVIYSESDGHEWLTIRAIPIEVPLSANDKSRQEGYSLSYHGLYIRLIGQNNRFFNSGFRKLKPLSVDDAFSWDLAFLNGGLNKYLTRKTSPKDSINDILHLFPEVPSETIEPWLDTHIFSPLEVEREPELANEDIVTFLKRRMCSMNLPRWTHIAMSELIIDEYGNARFSSVSRSSGIDEVDEIIKEESTDLCDLPFNPAFHRGRPVKCRFDVPFRYKWLFQE